MRLPFLFLFFFTGASPSDTADNNTLAKYNRYLPMFLGALRYPELEKTWRKCYHTDNGSLTMLQCGGVCVKKTKIELAPWDAKKSRNTTTFACQELDTYPLSMKHVCTNSKVEYPNVKHYFNRFTHATTVLYCCETDLCNAPNAHIVFGPQHYVQREHEEMMHYEITQAILAYLLVFVLLALPFVYWRRVKAEGDWLMNTLDDMPERAVQLMQFQMKIKNSYVKTPQTGQFTFAELTKRFAEMELFVRKKRVNRPLNHDYTKMQIKNYFLEAGGHGHRLLKADREVLVSYESLVWTILEHGPYSYEWKPKDLVEIFDQAKELFEAEPALLNLSLPITVIGDIRGQYADLMRWLQVVGPPPKQKLLFLGGIIDPQEKGSLDCLALIAAMKINYPYDIFVIRGVPETMPITFGTRFGPRDDATIHSAATRLCRELPIAARIQNRILAVHSGISHQLSNPKCFNLVHRPFGLNDIPMLARQLIFNQPTTAIKMYRSDPKSNSDFFGFTAVLRLCREMNLKMIIRARNPLPKGSLWNVRGKMLSIFSAPGKITKNGLVEYGTIVMFDAAGMLTMYTIKAQRDKTQDASQEKLMAPILVNHSKEKKQ